MLAKANEIIDQGKVATAGLMFSKGMHAVVLAGRKSIAGQCWYTFKNSWGKNGCGPYNPPPSVSCNDDGTIDIDEETTRSELRELLTLE